MNIICKLFGHVSSDDEFWENNSIDFCDRCKETRAFYHTGESYFTLLEWNGYVGHFFYKLKTFSQWCVYPLYYKIKKLINKAEEDDSVPF